MKKLLAMLLAIVMTLSLVSVMALAEGEQPKYVIDGVKDEAYDDRKSLDNNFWNFFDNNGQSTFEPLDYERVLNTVWFDWDDNYVYIYFQCVSKDNLYKPAADETKVADFDFGPFYEIAQIYLDTNPSAWYDGACIWAGQDGNGETCEHIACNCRGGSGSAHRLMARANPAWGAWNDYYANDAGMFMSYDQFAENYAGREGYEDMQAAYAAAHGSDGSEAVTFIDYNTNTYGFELKYPRVTEEKYFQFNIRTRVNETEWEEYGPELPYSLSMCNAWWLNADGMYEVWFEDYEVIDPKVGSIRRQIEELPPVELLDRSHKDAVNKIVAEFEALTEEQVKLLTEEELEWIIGAAVAMEMFDFIDSLGDVNEDDKVDAVDALVVLRAAVGKVELDEEIMMIADVTGDGEINAKDALEMLQFAVGKRDEFSVMKLLEEE